MIRSRTATAAGAPAYQAHCASCHRDDLQGSFEAPQLTGTNFLNQWGSRTTADILETVRATMPPGRGRSLGDQTYTDIVAFLLQRNGAAVSVQPLQPGTTPPTVHAAIAIRAGEPTAPGASAQAGTTPPAQARPPAAGLTVKGRVSAFTPVTDDMLKKPAPED